jgi:hypothetical protein
LSNKVEIRKIRGMQVDAKYLFYINQFCHFAAKHIGINTSIKLSLVNKTYPLSSTGMYMVNQYKIIVLYENRSLVDILRSIAHELQHQKQNELDQIPTNPQNIGGKLENEANIMCGILIKLFINDRKFIYKL